MDASLKRWRENVENQNKKLKALREASIERLHNISARRNSSPGDQLSEPATEFHIVQKSEALKEKPKEVTPAPAEREPAKTSPKDNIKRTKESVEKKQKKKSFIKTSPKLKKENIEKIRTSPKVKKENPEKTSPRVKTMERASSKQSTDIVPELNSLDDYARRILDTVDSQENRNSKLKKIKRILKKLVKGKNSQPSYEDQLEDLRRKCENTTTLITELEEKLYASEKEKAELKASKETLIGRLNDRDKELEVCRHK
eukprot:TRINITY_DN9196_c0_g2_i1.p1 TRINITY_DN9196_c0_g2~~TRINITY_DN9196_c0_g2_i1.p1  ORF type:complete len:257 (+),score=88.18 TRINITY_DN9196_c0_g2_i1:100-870(+)